MSRELLDTMSAVVERAQELSARIAERQQEIDCLRAERDHAAFQRRLIRLEYLRTLVRASSKARQEAVLEHLVGMDSAYLEYAD